MGSDDNCSIMLDQSPVPVSSARLLNPVRYIEDGDDAFVVFSPVIASVLPIEPTHPSDLVLRFSSWSWFLHLD